MTSLCRKASNAFEFSMFAHRVTNQNVKTVSLFCGLQHRYWLVHVAGVAFFFLFFARELASKSRNNSRPFVGDCLNLIKFFADRSPQFSSGIGLQISGKDPLFEDRLAFGGAARRQATWIVCIDLHELNASRASVPLPDDDRRI